MPKEITMQYSEWKSLTDENERLKKEVAQYESKSPAFAANEVKKEVEKILTDKLMNIIKKESNVALLKEQIERSRILHQSAGISFASLGELGNIKDVYKKIYEVHDFLTDEKSYMKTDRAMVRWLEHEMLHITTTAYKNTKEYKSAAADFVRAIDEQLKANY